MTTDWWYPEPPVEPVRRRRRRWPWVAAGVVVLLALAGVAAVVVRHELRPDADVGDYAYLRGINVYTLENVRRLPDSEVHGEPESTYEYLAAQGLRTIRLAVPWQSLQPVTDGDDTSSGIDAALDRPLDSRYVAVVKAEVEKIEDAGMFPVLDLHNGCGFPEGPGNKPADQVYCGNGLSTEHAVRIWQLLSEEFGDDDRIAAYDLFNEPTVGEVDPEVYKQVTQAVVTALRDRGDHHPLWVEAMKGSQISTLAPDGPWIDDPDHSTIYSAHFYPGYNAGPDYAFGDESRHDQFLANIEDFGRWCSNGGVRCSIGEIGWPGDQASPKPDAADQVQWNQLGDRAYDIADRYRMDVTYFGTSSNSVSTLWAFGAAAQGDMSSDARLDQATGVRVAFSQAGIIEKHPSPRRTTGAK